MHRIFKTVCVIAIFCAAPAWAAAEDPLSYFGSDVDVVLRLKEPDQTLEKLVKIINKVQPGVGTQLQTQLTSGLGMLISNPELHGVDQSRDWYAAVYTSADSDPVVVFAIPAVDPKDLIAGLSEEMTTQVQGNWVLYSAADALPTVDPASTLVTKLGETGSSELSQGDLKVYVNIEHLTEIYDEELGLAQEKVLENLNQLRFLPNNDGVDVETIIEMYGAIIEGLFQGIDDANTGTFGITLSDNDLHFMKQVAFADGTDSAKLFAAMPTSEIPSLMKLPTGASVYFGISGVMKQLIGKSMDMIRPIIDDEKQLKELEELTARLGDIHFGPMAGSLEAADVKSGAMRVVGIAAVEPLEEYKKISRAYVKASGNIKTEAFEQSAELQVDAETYGESKADVIHMKQEYSGEGDQAAIQEKTQQLMFGEEGIVTRIVYLKDAYVTTMGGGTAAMTNALKALNGTSQKANPLEKYRTQVMPKANLLLFIDLPKFGGNILRVVSRIEDLKLPINSQMIDALNLKPSYISLAAGAEGNVVKSEMRLPVDQIIGVTKLGVLIGTSVQGQRGF